MTTGNTATNEAYFDELYADNIDRITDLCDAYGVDECDIDDVCQDVFLRIWQNLDTYDPARASIETWVGVIAERIIIDYGRSRACFDDNIVLANEMVDAFASTDGLPLDDLLYSERVGIVKAAIDTLNEGDQEILYLYNDGYTYQEIAGRVGRTVKQIDNKLVYLKQRIRNDIDALYAETVV